MSTIAGRAAIVAVGDELVSGEQPDKNIAWLAQRLGELGYTVEIATLVGDDEQGIAALFRQLANRAELVFSSGGLGPTLDDLTRHAAAAAAGVELVLDDESLAQVRAHCAARGTEASPASQRQALLPDGARLLPNSVGTAPGFVLGIEGSHLVVLPGPPRELQVVFEEQVQPFLLGLPRPALGRSAARFFLMGLAESDFAGAVGAWMAREANPRMGVCAGRGVLKVKLEATGANQAEAQEILAARVELFRTRFSKEIFSEEDAEPALALGRLLIERGVTCATAESCTGGALAAALTQVPGISAVFREGFVTYSNEAKQVRLGVSPADLATHGAVSEEVAGAMSRGAAERAGASLAISTTGIAGPSGGNPKTPVGLVCFGVTHAGATRTYTRRFRPRGRSFVRDWAVNASCELARRALLR
jgi:nicotinamide-nucleotide amidase